MASGITFITLANCSLPMKYKEDEDDYTVVWDFTFLYLCLFPIEQGQIKDNISLSGLFFDTESFHEIYTKVSRNYTYLPSTSSDISLIRY